MKNIKNWTGNVAVLICCCLFFLPAAGQNADTTQKPAPHKKDNIFQFALKAFTKSQTDSATYATVINTKAETSFLPYQGKGIRHIFVRHYDFDHAFNDSSKEFERNTGSKILNSLHRNSREWVVRNNLFIAERSVLNAYKVADNERYLRSLEFIQDARIYVRPIAGEPDSVDLMVITKDLFSITGEINNVSTNSYKGSITDANALGFGQKIQFTTSVEPKRDPGFGYAVAYVKRNIANSFVDVYLLYGNINNDLHTGASDEHVKSISLQRPLFSQYSHLAGAFSLGDYQALNTYHIPDSLFYSYHYLLADAWIGYNIGTNKLFGLNASRDRRFLSFRYLQNHFSEVPVQVADKYNFKFNDRQAALAQFTFFRQDFYKTNYVYGFGTTEDIPYGYNIAVTSGWYKQLQLNRIYAGVDANWYVVTKQKAFIQYFLRTGGFWNNGRIEDAAVLFGSSVFSRLYPYKGIKIRQYLNVSYTRQFNRVGIDPLRIDNIFGIRYFSSDSVFGNQRMSLHTETSFFLKYKVFGFKFAPFSFADFSLITPEKESFSKSALFYSLGGGVRTRNENFVFGTIELRVAYFPRKSTQSESFKITTDINIQFKYNSNYVQEPDIIQLNTDNNKIYQ